jgi:hypothetical protein
MKRSDDDFDGYRKWLGITNKRRLPTHYELLSISLDEDDPEVIHAAAEQRRHFVESKRGGGHDGVVTEILYRISEAETTLLNNEMRRGYDRKLDLFQKRQKNRQIDPHASRSRIRSRPGPTVGEGTGFVSTFAGILVVFCVAIAVMTWFSFQLPWFKAAEQAEAAPVAQVPAPVAAPAQVAPVPAPVVVIPKAAQRQAAEPVKTKVKSDKPLAIARVDRVAVPPIAEAEVGRSSPLNSIPDSTSLFDGKTLNGWKISTFKGRGPVSVEGNEIILGKSNVGSSGITYKGEFPNVDYEVSVEAKRVSGDDFFCGMTFPIGNSECTLIVGGWGGTVVGLSSIDGKNASENQTTTNMRFENGRWYSIRLSVTQQRIKSWIDDTQVIDQPIAGHHFSILPQIEPSRRFGIAAYRTKAALRNIETRTTAK